MRSLSSRERTLCICAAVSIMLLVSVQLIVRPTWAQKAGSLATLQHLDALSSVLDVLPEGQVTPRSLDLPPLRVRVTQSAQSAGLEIQRLDPDGAALLVSLGDVAFPALIGWLDHIATKGNARVLTAQIGRLPAPGRVTAQLLLEDR